MIDSHHSSGNLHRPCAFCAINGCSFRCMDPDRRHQRELDLGRGERLEGDETGTCLKFWVVLQGTAATCTTFADGRRQILSLETPGDIICGLMASHGGQTWLEALSDAGADIFHCSQRRFWEPEFEGSSLNFAGWAKKLTGKPTISVGSVGLEGDFLDTLAKGMSSERDQHQRMDELEQRMSDGEFDLIAVGRALLQDPNWVAKLRDGREDELQSFDVKSMMALS